MKSLSRFILLAIQALSWQAESADDWPYYQHDPGHTGRSTAVIDPTSLSLAWSSPAGYLTPLIVGDALYATQYTSQGQLSGLITISSFKLSTGLMNWSFVYDVLYPSQ